MENYKEISKKIIEESLITANINYNILSGKGVSVNLVQEVGKLPEHSGYKELRTVIRNVRTIYKNPLYLIHLEDVEVDREESLENILKDIFSYKPHASTPLDKYLLEKLEEMIKANSFWDVINEEVIILQIGSDIVLLPTNASGLQELLKRSVENDSDK